MSADIKKIRKLKIWLFFALPVWTSPSTQGDGNDFLHPSGLKKMIVNQMPTY